MNDGRFGQEHRAAVLVRLYRGVVSAYLLGDCHDFVLVHAYERTEYGERRGIPCARHAFHRLGSDLSQALSRDERAAVVRLRKTARDAHHESAHYRDHHVGRAILVYGKLYIRERHDEKTYLSGIFFGDISQFRHLFARFVGRVRRRGKVHGEYLHAAFCHHVRRHRGIYAPGQQQHSAPGAPDGKSARAGNDVRIDEGDAVFAHIHPEVAVIVRKVHLVASESKHRTAERRRYLGGRHGDALVGALHRHAETQLPLRVFGGFFCGFHQRLPDFGEILVRTHRHFVRNGKRMYAEHPCEPSDQLSAVVVGKVLDKISALRA